MCMCVCVIIKTRSCREASVANTPSLRLATRSHLIKSCLHLMRTLNEIAVSLKNVKLNLNNIFENQCTEEEKKQRAAAQSLCTSAGLNDNMADHLAPLMCNVKW